MSSKSDPAASQKSATCPICKAPAVPDYRPFCSKRCADIDLHRWLAGGYAIPAVGTDDDQGSADENE